MACVRQPDSTRIGSSFREDSQVPDVSFGARCPLQLLRNAKLGLTHRIKRIREDRKWMGRAEFSVTSYHRSLKTQNLELPLISRRTVDLRHRVVDRVSADYSRSNDAASGRLANLFLVRIFFYDVKRDNYGSRRSYQETPSPESSTLPNRRAVDRVRPRQLVPVW